MGKADGVKVIRSRYGELACSAACGSDLESTDASIPRAIPGQARRALEDAGWQCLRLYVTYDKGADAFGRATGEEPCVEVELDGAIGEGPDPYRLVLADIYVDRCEVKAGARDASDPRLPHMGKACAHAKAGEYGKMLEEMGAALLLTA